MTGDEKFAAALEVLDEEIARWVRIREGCESRYDYAGMNLASAGARELEGIKNLILARAGA